MSRLRYKLQNFMRGRYGQDELSKALNWLAVILIVVSMLPHLGLAYLLGIIAFFWSIFRTMSRNITARQTERMSYLRVSDKYSRRVKLEKKKFAERKTHDYYKCPRCGTYNRVPKGHGRIEITCPRCRERFIKG